MALIAGRALEVLPVARGYNQFFLPSPFLMKIKPLVHWLLLSGTRSLINITNSIICSAFPTHEPEALWVFLALHILLGFPWDPRLELPAGPH